MNLKNKFLTIRVLALIWLMVPLGCALWIGVRANADTVINANLISLLPAVERDPHLQSGVDKLHQHIERGVVLLISSSNATTSKAAAKMVIKTLKNSKTFAELNFIPGDDFIKQAGKFYFPLRFNLLSNKARLQLANGDYEEFERAVLARYFNPTSSLRSDLIERDPLHLMLGFLEERSEENSVVFETEDGLLVLRDLNRTYVLLSGILNESPFSLQMQDQLEPIIAELNVSASRAKSKWEIIKAGVFFHASAGTERAKEEISTVGIGAVIGILLLFILVFRSWQPLALTLFSIIIGCIGGFTVCLAIFGQVNLLTLVFGTSLIGISVDYSFHYFCEHLRQKQFWSSKTALNHIFPGISLGLITSIIGFSGLLFASFPGMQQLAVFSIVGLIFAYICVLTIYPIFAKNIDTDHMKTSLNWSAAYVRFCHSLWGPKAYMILGMLLIVSVMGITQLKPEDNIRHLQSSDSMVLAEQNQIQGLLGDGPASQFFLISGSDEGELLARQEMLLMELRNQKKLGHISGYISLSDFVPSPRRQRENHRLLTSIIVDENSLLRRVGQKVGMPNSIINRYVNDFTNTPPDGRPRLEEWLDTPMARPFRYLWLGAHDNKFVSAVGLRGLHQPAALRDLEKTTEGITYVDNVSDLSGLFSTIRYQSGWLILGSYLFVSVLLFLRYGLRGGVAVMLVPVIATTISLGIQGLIGEPLTLFNVLAVMLVLGIGVDYGIFFRETGNKHPSTLVAIGLSSVTTLLAFGLLALSSTTAVHSFGLTILVGIATALFLSPIAGINRRTKEAKR